ncbi:MAG: rod shape-determining protein MreC [Selenomonadaceae bacterium]|nr:rod shape-determining protein MreC [Selenomonadaceae bacterium]
MKPRQELKGIKPRSRKDKNQNSNKTAAIIFVLAFVFLSIFIVAKTNTQVPAASKTMMFFLSPFQKSFSWVGGGVSDLKDSVEGIENLQEETTRLRAEVEKLRAENLNASEALSENQRLRALLGYKQNATQFDLIAASIVGRDSVTWSSVVTINRGTLDGVADNMAVVTELGLVGHVVEAGLNTSKVQLILDPRSSVGTLIQRPESRVAGIVEGDINNPNAPKMVNIPKDADVKVDDMIVTSGFGGIYPKGVIVGKIKEIHNDEGGLLKHGIVATTVNFEKLEDVAVIVNSRETPPEPLPPVLQTAGTELDAEEVAKQLEHSKIIQQEVRDSVKQAQQLQLEQAQKSGGGTAN